MRFGVTVSILLHACLIGLAFVSLPSFLRTKIIDQPVVPIELISKAELAKETSVPAAAPKPKPKPEEKKPEPEEKPEPTPKPEEKKAAAEPPPLPEPKKEEAKKPDEKKEAVKPPATKAQSKPKKEDLDLDALSALVDKAKKKEEAGSDVSGATIESDRPHERIGTGDRLTASDIDKMRAAVARCWNASAIIGAPNPEKLVVVIDIDLNRDGSLKGDPRVTNALEISLSGNRFWQVAQQNAVRAVIACAPYDFFDQGRYNDWRAFTLNFDPSQMAGF